MILLLISLLLICAVGWLAQYVSCLSLAMYMATKNYTPPSDAELKACSNEVVKRLFSR